MPGVIGASIFSPLPARGYRFHSLHFEIISNPLAALRALQNLIETRSAPFAPQFERLTAPIVPEPRAEARICGLTLPDASHRSVSQAVSANPVTSLHCKAGPALLLAAGG